MYQKVSAANLRIFTVCHHKCQFLSDPRLMVADTLQSALMVPNGTHIGWAWSSLPRIPHLVWKGSKGHVDNDIRFKKSDTFHRFIVPGFYLMIRSRHEITSAVDRFGESTEL